MTAHPDAATDWQAAGTITVLLPTGTEIRGMLPGSGSLARRGITPGILRDIASRLTGEAGQGGMSDEDWATWEDKVRDVIAEFVTAIRPPGHDEFSEHRIEPEHRVPPIDLDALIAIALRFESPAQVDARSRVALKGQPATSAASLWARTAHATLPAWSEFIESGEGLLCAISARTWGCRPSALLGIDDPVVAYAVDEALSLRLLYLNRGKRKGPHADEFYESVQVPYDPDLHARSQAARIAELKAEGLLH